MPDKKNSISRRDFLKTMAGFGGIALIGPQLADVTKGLAQDVASYDFSKRPWWVKEVDDINFGIDPEKYGRFHGDTAFKLLEGYINERDGEGGYDALMNLEYDTRKSNIENNVPGFELRDYALQYASWMLSRASFPGYNLLSWNGIFVPTPEDFGVEPYKDTPEEMANTIKQASRLFGAATVGITELQERFVPKEVHYAFPGGPEVEFADIEKPNITEDDLYQIPKKMKRAIVVCVAQSPDASRSCPTQTGDAATSLGYSHLAFVVSSLAEFVRGLGYQAIPTINDTGLSVPLAAYAGIGELSRMNILVTPEFGPNVRIAKVYTDMPLAMDKPISFGVKEFCTTCLKCAENCPAGALSMDAQPNWEPKGPYSNPGHEAWFPDYYKCHEYWSVVTSGCSRCVSVCPFTKISEAWAHNVVKATASTTTFFNSFFKEMDDAFGYGEEKDPGEWWYEDHPAFGIYSTHHTRR